MKRPVARRGQVAAEACVGSLHRMIASGFDRRACEASYEVASGIGSPRDESIELAGPLRHGRTNEAVA